jgi:hypothetical protein
MQEKRQSMDRETAEKILAMAMDCSRKVDESVQYVIDTCSSDELLTYRRHIGMIMAGIFESILAPIYDEYSDLAPDWYNEMNARMKDRQSKK